MQILLTRPTYNDLLFFSDEIERLLTVIELQDIKPATRIIYMREVISINTKVRSILDSLS